MSICNDGAMSTPEPLQCITIPVAMPSADLVRRQSLVFKALGDPNRLTLMYLVASAYPATICVCDLTAALDLQQPTVSHHLRVLVDTGLLQREKRGNWVHYSLMPGAWEIVRAVQAVQTTQAT
ncbi:helix-turn-helix transcriptional regulator [Corynebacterium diphtheriae bv. mitis]|uniref:ArsR/SmtB family transcription factor n=2 Tax=Corynebacterium diphtheriae TaxID=1717 RepID=UPI00089350AB|nr:metalloregulator ArsR/SmtB family transcription factor [Corynebacterium diphtheriae]MBG9345599.1 helix-turn-helix transcriptional regulator [Corynebacterium diphtheriae bv. gravis]MBG9245591.1 helix-turn-helix transcriptional regulator [Corynebacterium diphtheriae bv. mitis]MBG9352669.1 helix-turn-helix transcriptional regulator [Corynebacterium diphtheriae bv. gravis]OFI53775.1 hypothetical protein BKD82_04515 [Corynebacterium diphtheriae]OFI56799.1 hypothetical protein BKD84_04360 [Coryne